jgi:glucokinase
MFTEVRRRSFTFARTGTKIEKAALGADAGLFGAAYLPYQYDSSRVEVAG